MALLKSIMTISGHTMISRILGYVRESLIATYVGANAITDALNIAIKIPSLFRRLFAEGAFNAAFVPMFSGNLATKGKQSAKVFAEHSIVILGLFLTVMVLVIELFMPEFIGLLAAGFSKTPERLELAIEFTRITFPFILFISISAILGGVLNSLEKFAAPAAAASIGNLCIIFVIYFFVNSGKSPGHVLSWGVLFSSICQLAWLYFFCAYAGMPLKFRVPKLTPEMKEFFRKLLPGMVGAGILQINLVVDMRLCSYLPEASVSYLNLADRINQFPLSMVGVAMGVALLPLLSKQLRQGNLNEAITTQNRATELVLFLTLPAAIAFVIYADLFVSLLYGYGKFLDHPGNIPQTARTLAAFSFGLPAYVMVKVFSSTFFARSDTLTPVIIGLISVVVNIVINLYLMGPYQHVGIAMGTAIASWINAILLIIVLQKRRMFVFDSQFLSRIPKILCASAIMGVVIYCIQPYFDVYIVGGSVLGKIDVLFALLFASAISFLTPAYFLKCIDLKNIRK